MMKILSISIIVTCFCLMACGPKAKKSSQSVASSPRLTIGIDSLKGITPSNSANFILSGNCLEEGQPIIVRVGGVSPETAPMCTSDGTWSTDIDLTSLSGASREISITVDQWTSDGQALPQATGSILLHPRVTIEANLLDITGDNAANFMVSGTCSEEGRSVIVNVGGVVATSNCSSEAWAAELDVSSLSGPSRIISITADHLTSGNLAATQATGSTLLPPRVMVATDLVDITSTNLSSFEVRGTCSENGQPVTVSMGGVSATPNCTSLAWTTEIDLSSLTGASRSIAITANHATSGGLEAEEATGSTLLHPRVSINADAVGITSANEATFSVSGTCSEEGQAVTVSVDTVSATSTCATGGTWTAEVDMSGLTGDSRPIVITADHATSDDPPLVATQATGSVIAYLSFSIDELEDITAANAGSFTVSGSCLEEGQPVAVVVGEGEGSVSPGANPDCTNGAWTITMDVTGLNKTEGDISVTADHSPATGSAHPQQTQTVTNEFICPEDYVGVPALADYTTNSFCVMKYEAKSDESDTDGDDTDDNNAVSQATGTPYVNISQTDSITKCTATGEGYDLITNDEWQSVARNIELVSDNWDTGAVGNAGGLSRGHSDNVPSNALAASNDDTEGCEGTEQTCSNTVWDSQRRTHTLSNGEVIWDIAGNVWEWVKDTNDVDYGENAFMSQVTTTSHSTQGSLAGGTTTTPRAAKDQFGPSGDYSSLDMTPYGGLGWGLFIRLTEHDGGYRGGYWNGQHTIGVFAVNLVTGVTNVREETGFRCVHHP